MLRRIAQLIATERLGDSNLPRDARRKSTVTARIYPTRDKEALRNS